MNTRIFIVEDELIHAEAMKIVLEKLEYEIAGECDNADNAFDLIKKTMPDALLVDISLPGVMNGMTLANKVHKELGIPHIFTTSMSHEDIIDEAIDTKPAAFLRKPVDAVNLSAAIKIALQPVTKASAVEKQVTSEVLYTKIGNKLVRIDLKDILIIKANGENYISLISERKEVNCRCTLKELSPSLPKGFIQVHRSYLINLNHLDSFNEQEQTVCLKGHEAPIARGYRKDFLNCLKRI
jgi:DNA-binding LytR/AlgR family response regulator